jgi:hypothetical protein
MQEPGFTGSLMLRVISSSRSSWAALKKTRLLVLLRVV